MTQAAAQFVGAIPENYDSCLGPILFEPYARDLAARAARLAPLSVLEIAAGTGISTRELRAALPASAKLTATDLNPPMLEIAKTKFPGGTDIVFQQADALALPFADASFDLAACQFGVMFFPDKVAGLREAKRVLKPGGALLFNVWGTKEANEFSLINAGIGERFFPDNPPKFYDTPFGYHDIARVHADLGQAGFTDIRHDVVRLTPNVKDWAHFARGAVYGNPMIAEIEASKSVKADDVVDAITEALRARFGKEPATMPLEAIVYEAR